MHHGVFAVGRPPQTPLERAAAAVLACGPGAALSHHAALALWGLSARWPPRMEVSAPSDRRHPGLIAHHCPALAPHDVRVRDRIRVTSPARTLLDCAPTLASRRLTRAVNDGLRTGLVTEPQLAEVCRRCPTHPGARRLSPFLQSPNAPTRSEFEDRFVAFCETYELPTPQVNAHVAGHEVDALFPEQRVIVELDGWSTHGDRTAFETDRERDADALAAGHVTVRITWQRLDRRPAAEAARLRRILAARGGSDRA